MSEDSVQSSSVNDTSMTQKKFGSAFKVAREAEHLTVDDVSDALKLPQEVVLALESSQLDKLPEPTYTRGYIRNYARFLKLSEDEILALYNQQTPESKVKLSARSKLSRQVHSGEFKFKLLTYALMLTAFVIMLFWWFQSTPVSHDMDVLDEELTLLSEDDNKLTSETLKLSENKASATDEVQVDDLTIEAPEQINQNDVVLESETAEHQDEINEIKEVVKEPIVSASPIEIKKEKLVTTPIIKASISKPEKPVNIGEDVLFIATISESWVQVDDVNRSRLLYELIKRGKDYRVQGQAPFKIFLGNAPAVTVQINSHDVDLASYTSSDNLVRIYLHDDGEVVRVSRRKKSDNITKVQDSMTNDQSLDNAQFEPE